MNRRNFLKRMGLAPVAVVAVAQQGAAKLAQPVEQAAELSGQLAQKMSAGWVVPGIELSAETPMGVLATDSVSKVWDITVTAGSSFIKGVDGWVDNMNMGAATIPNLSELEAEIERRGALVRMAYATALQDAADARGLISSWGVIRLTRLTETQKVQAALKALGEK